jgi:nucleotide-binding universal stress UspA family protein
MPKTPLFRSILVGTDGSPTAATAVHHAISLAEDADARLVIAAAFQTAQPQRTAGDRTAGDSLTAPEDIRFTMDPEEYARAVLETCAEDARTAGVTDVVTVARMGGAADVLLDVAEEQECDLIVVGNKGMTGARRLLVGSVPNNVSHGAACSVMIVRTT